jgi:ATP-dependent Clp protease ATP-binding subunit ClpC
MTEPESHKPYIICPECQGDGKNKIGFACPNCAGLGVGTFFRGRFYFWGPKLSRTIIEMDYFRKKFNLFVNLSAYTIGLFGLISLGLWIYITSQNNSELGVFAIWRQQHFLILFFWLSVVADLFVVYRMSEEIRLKKVIVASKFEDRNRIIRTPDNWKELKAAKSKYKLDVSSGFAPNAIDTIESSFLLTQRLGHRHLTPLHLFFSSLADPQVAAIFSRLNIDGKKLIDKLKNHISIISNTEGKTRLSNTVKEALIEAYLQAEKLGQKRVSPKNFIIPLINKNKILEEILYEMEVDKEKVFNVILWFIINEQLVDNYRTYKRAARFKPSKNMDRAYTSVQTRVLNQISYDLTIAAKWGRLEFCVARQQEIDKVFQIFESGINGVILVGPRGVGKKSIVEGIAQAMVREDVPKFMQDKRLVELDSSRLISGSSASQAEGRLLAVIDEVARAGNIILFINNVENIVGISSGSEGSLDLSEVLTTAIERKNIYCIASSIDQHYAKAIEGKSLGNAMSKVDVREPEGNQAIQIIESKIGQMEGKYGVYFSYNAIEWVVKYSEKYIHDKYLPEKAINILEMVAVRVSREKGDQGVVTKNDIAATISEITHIPITKISESESQKLINLESDIHQKMIGQEEAVKMVAASLRRARTELREGKRPIANFLFLGPTGVGKTELAKTVADIYFGDEDYMIRVDMSEYQHPDSVNKMIGDANGAKGYLTEAVRKAPYSLILLDEIEKAHPDILNLFLQVMDDGRLTDGQGRTIDFTNSILIATSNAGAQYIQDQIYAGARIEDIKTVLINEHLNKIMRPELINRFDGVIVFEPLSMDNVVLITKLMLGKIGKMLEVKGIGLRYEEEGVKILAKLGYDPKFGARPLRRLLQEKVEDQIANQILAGNLNRRDTLIIDADASIRVEKAMRV